MKRFEKGSRGLLAIIAAFMLAFAMLPASASAAEDATYSLTVTGTTTGHTYEVYKIFSGDLSTDASGNKILSNVEWAGGVTYTGTETSAANVAEKLGKGEMTLSELIADLGFGAPSQTVASTDGSTVVSGLSAGYYLLKDQDTTQSGTSDAYTSFIVEVVGDTMAAVKSDVPTVTKKVMDKDDTEGATSSYQDSADYHIGDTIPYRIVGTMPANIDAYSTYAYKLTDTMSAGLAYGSDAKIFLDGVDVTGSFVQTVTDNADGTTTVTWEVANLKALGTLTPASEVTVNYTATLDTDAVIGSAGNPNSVNLVYSNNPNTGGEGDTGKTPDDKTVVFTYKVVVNKTDAAGTALTGAEFTLYKQLATGERIEIAAVKSGDGTQFSFNGLDDGTYILKETKTPAGFNTIDDIEFTITAEHEALSDDPRLTSLNGSPTTTGAIEFGSSTTEGSLTAAVVNESGTTLPSTGGMGTRWIYGIGILLVGSAVAYFVIRKRRNGSAD